MPKQRRHGSAAAAAAAAAAFADANALFRDAEHFSCNNGGCKMMGRSALPGEAHNHVKDPKTGMVSPGFADGILSEGARIAWAKLQGQQARVATAEASSGRMPSESRSRKRKKSQGKGRRQATMNESESASTRPPAPLPPAEALTDLSDTGGAPTLAKEAATIGPAAPLPPDGTSTLVSDTNTGGDSRTPEELLAEITPPGPLPPAEIFADLITIGGQDDGGESRTVEDGGAGAGASTDVGGTYQRGGGGSGGGVDDNAATGHEGAISVDSGSDSEPDEPLVTGCGTLINKKGNVLSCCGCGLPGELKGCGVCPGAYHVGCLPPGSNSYLAAVQQTPTDRWFCPTTAARGFINLVDGTLLYVLAAAAAGEHRIHHLMATVKEHREMDRQREENLRHIKALGAGQARMCSLCHGVIGDAYLECDRRDKIEAARENTWLRSVGCHGRVGGHLTCFPCLKEQQGLEISDLSSGNAKWDTCLACKPTREGTCKPPCV